VRVSDECEMTMFFAGLQPVTVGRNRD
jgi:hypothetical protein